MIELSDEQVVELADALMAADEVLSILYHHGTKGIEKQFSADRIADVFHKVHLTRALTGAATVPVVRTDEAVGLLPVGSVLFDVDKDVIVRAVEGWRHWGDDSEFTEEAVICLPAMVIYTGESEPWHAAG